MPAPRFSELQHSPRARGLVFALAALACCALLALAFPAGLTRLELAASDLRYRLAPRPRPSAALVLVDIDDATVRRYGKWPLSRAVHARVLDVLTDCGVAAVGYDIVFHGPAQGERGEAEDAALEAAIARSGRVVFPAGVGLVREADTVRLTPDADDLPLLPALLPPGDLHVPDLLQVEKSFLPLARFSRHALGLGHIAATPDADGAYRRMPLVVGFHGQLLPCLGLALARQALGASVSARPGAVVLAWPAEGPNKGPKNGQAGGTGASLAVPMDAQGLAPVNLAAPYGSGFWHLSYAEVLDAAADPARLAFLRKSLAGKVVLVGLTATGTSDIKATPLSPAEPLVTLHANLTSQLLTRSVLRPAPAWAAPAVFALFLAACALCFLRLPMRWFPAAGLGLAALYPAANVALYAATGISLNLAPASLGLFVFALALLAHGLMRAATDSARQRRMLEVYFSPAIARQILESGADIMQGRSVDVSVLFSDIAGFTAMSDRMEPAEVQRFLGEYLEEMTACVYNNGGAVDKFMGDGIMAFFGYPEAEGADSVENARRSALSGVRAAVEMQAALQRLNARWQAQGRQKIAIRIGVNTGHCIVGDMGSASRRDFTLLGRNVNLAQRLEANCPQGGVLLSARTAALVSGQFDLGEPYSLKVKGFDAEVEVRTVRLPEQLRGAAPEA